jgi:hypothetical protein
MVIIINRKTGAKVGTAKNVSSARKTVDRKDTANGERITHIQAQSEGLI